MQIAVTISATVSMRVGQWGGMRGIGQWGSVVSVRSTVVGNGWGSMSGVGQWGGMSIMNWGSMDNWGNSVRDLNENKNKRCFT